MTDSETGYVPVLSYNLLHPIAHLWEQLEKKHTGRSNEVQVATMENGHAAAVIVLIVVFMESVLSRVQYIEYERNEKNSKPAIKALEFFSKFCTEPALVEAAKDAFVLRDVIVHNHIWSSNIKTADEGLSFVGTPLLLPGFGDAKFRDRIDVNTRTTKYLGLHVFPTRIDFTDAIKVLATAHKLTKYVEDKDRNYCYLGHMRISFRDDGMTVDEFFSVATGQAKLEALHKGEIAEKA